MNAALAQPLPLIPAKLCAPALHPGLLARPRFDEWLQRLRQVRLAVLQAPSGFGKTVLASQWAAAFTSTTRSAAVASQPMPTFDLIVLLEATLPRSLQFSVFLLFLLVPVLLLAWRSRRSEERWKWWGSLVLRTLVVLALLAGARPARYYLLAWSALLVGVVVYMLKTFGWLPHNMLTQNAFQLGSLIEMVLLSLALGSRVRELKRSSYLDALTGLCNRRHFDSQMLKELQLAHQLGRPLSLLLLDIDHFKRFNDNHGHQAGDRALQKVARLLQCEVRKPFIACRHGGEEFAVIMPNSSAADATVLAERLRRELANMVECDTPLTLSIGLASLADGPFERPEQLFAAADEALYAAKRGGRDQLVCYQG